MHKDTCPVTSSRSAVSSIDSRKTAYVTISLVCRIQQCRHVLWGTLSFRYFPQDGSTSFMYVYPAEEWGRMFPVPRPVPFLKKRVQFWIGVGRNIRIFIFCLQHASRAKWHEEKSGFSDHVARCLLLLSIWPGSTQVATCCWSPAVEKQFWKIKS